ncbi:hypothetical protein [Formosa maritima]|uniref:Uncharacterized protein n=1 Tax=Formosa maritima TaxID=2592046 RepID=A0A5D0G072_9FLAO|nr:hypothetical protein [Formosa maritima]TYA52258.1 hypothetical protein FVF61_13020 [Formosa maritima]
MQSDQSKANSDNESLKLVVTDSGLTINSEHAIYLESSDGLYHSYTFPVIEESTESNIIKNALISLQPDGNYKTFLVTYNLPLEVKSLIDAGETPSVVEYITFTDIEDLDLAGMINGLVHYDEGLNICYEYQDIISQGTGWVIGTDRVEVPCPPGVGYNSGGGGGTTGEPGNGETNNPHELEGEGNNNFPGDGHGSGGPGIGNNNSGNSTGTGNATVLIDNITAMQINVLNLLNLSDITEDSVNNQDVIDWIKDDLNAYQLKRVQTFLQNHEVSEEAIAFAMEAIEALLDGGEVDFEELYIQTDTPDDNYVYLGQKVNIPNQIILNDNSIVNVTFNSNTSDGVSSNQEVSIYLLESIEFALNEANNNLDSSDKINEVNIYCTTNGNHSTTSNHYNGTAVDINSINRQRMALTGVTNQIIQLQEGFDNYQYIRENFGPHFKHKYDIYSNTWNHNYPVGGHGDHIHISVRVN